MKHFTKLFYLLLLIPSLVLGQTITTDGYFNDFSSGAGGWWGGSEYTVSASNETLEVDVHKEDRWANFGVSIGDTIDCSGSPYINVKAKGDKPFNLYVYMQDASGDNYSLMQSVMESDTFVNLSYEYNSPGADFALDSVVQLMFVVNGLYPQTNTIWLDDLSVGSFADNLCNVGGLPDQTFYVSSGIHKIDIAKLDNVNALSLSGGGSLINSHSFSAISGNDDGFSTLSLDLQAGATGEDLITITGTGASGYNDNTISFNLEVVSNAAPEIDSLANQEVRTGEITTIELSGISDGDAAADQNLSFNVKSDAQGVIPDGNLSIDHDHGSPYAVLTVQSVAAGSANITIGVIDDSGESNDSSGIQCQISAFNNFNYNPTLDDVIDLSIKDNAGDQTMLLTGVSDGNNFSQSLSFSVSSTTDSVIHPDSITFGYTQGATTAIMNYVPGKEGQTTVTITLEDDATGTDNGVKQTSKSFEVQVIHDYPKGIVLDLSDMSQFQYDGCMPTTSVDSGSFHALRIDANNKWIWCALWMILPTPLDLTNDPYISMDIWSVSDSTLHWLWFWDNGEDYDPENAGGYGYRNTFPDVTHDEGKAEWVKADEQWHHVTFDFSGENEMARNDGGNPVPINAANIEEVLFNFHQEETAWPRPPEYNGTIFIKNIRIGDKAEMGWPDATIDNVADQVHYVSPGEQTITLTGITDGYLNSTATPNLFVSSDNSSFADPTASTVQSDGTAKLTYTPAAGVDSAKITLTVNADSSFGSSIDFMISTVDPAPANALSMQVYNDSTYQTMRGFGAYYPELGQLDIYANDLGASSMRVGLIGNQIETKNDNDDPYVLNRDGMNYSGLDFRRLRMYKEAGVESFILTSWSPPEWMKLNYAKSWPQNFWQESYDNSLNKLEEFHYDEFAEMWVAAVKMFKEEAGIDLLAVGPQNEPRFNEPYPSGLLDPEHFAIVCDTIARRFRKEGLSTKIFMPEDVVAQNPTAYLTEVQSIPAVDSTMDAYAVHGYAGDGIQAGYPDYSEWESLYADAQEGSYPKELWMTETHVKYEGWDNAMQIAGALYGALKYGNVNLWNFWNFGMFLDNGKPNGQFYTYKNYTKYIRPGAVRIKIDDAGDPDIMATAYKNDAENQDKQVVVVVNKAAEPKTISLTGDFANAYQVYTSAEFVNFEYKGVINGDSVLSLPAESVTTLSEVVGNIAPTINQIGNQTIEVNSGEQTIILAGITDGNPNSVQSVSVTATSDNEDLILNSGVNVAYTNGNTATLTYEARTDSMGSATLNVRVKDDGGTANGGVDTTIMSFDVTVTAEINHDPTISNIDDESVLEDAGEQTIGLTGITDGDDGGIDQGVTVTAVSSDPSIVPNPTISAVQAGGTAILTYTPVDEMSGSVNINLTVQDGGGSPINNGDAFAYTSFAINITAVNDAPTVDSTVNVVSSDTSYNLDMYSDVLYIDVNGGMRQLIFNGISDGDDGSQTISMDASIDSTSVLSINSVSYTNGESDAEMFIMPMQKGVGNITVVFTDNGGTANGGVDTVSLTIPLEVTDGTGINEAGYDELAVYPNPADNSVNVVLPSDDCDYLTITNISGEIIRLIDLIGINGKVLIDLNNIESGWYVISVIGENCISRQQLIIQ